MINQENIIINGKQFVKTYSDSGYYIMQNETGILYSEAIDVVPLKYTYTETSEVIEDESEEMMDQQTEQ